jgi:hypothetical protein
VAEHAVIEEPAAAEPAQQRPPAAHAPDALGALGALRAAGNSAIAGLLRGGLRAPLTRQVEGNPTAPPGTANADPTVADAANHQAPAAAGGQSGTVTVKVKATADAPLEGESVAEEDLFEKQATQAPDSSSGGSGSPSSGSSSAPPDSSTSSSPAPADSSATSSPASSDPSGGTSSPASPDGFTTVQEISGSAAAPMVEESADSSLFIDPGPKADDVQQGQIGDCWDMATFIAIVSSDPGKILSIMTPDGAGGASVSFYRRQAAAGGAGGAGAGAAAPTYEYIPTVVAVNQELPMDLAHPDVTPSIALAIRTMVGDQPYGHSIHGAQLRAADTPKVRKWWCLINGSKLEIHRLDVYQMARWSPLLEKAGARFSEQYGQYGHGEQVDKANDPEQEHNDPSGGYGNLEGGFGYYTMTMFYGQEAEHVAGGQADGSPTAAVQTNATSEAVLNANQAAFERLLTLAGQGGGAGGGAPTGEGMGSGAGASPDGGASAGAGGQPADGKTSIVTAGTSGPDVYMERLREAIAGAEGDADWRSLAAPTPARLTKVTAAIKAWEGAAPDPSPLPTPPPANCKTATQEEAGTAATEAADPAKNPTLVDQSRSKAIKDMLDQLLIIQNIGKDHGARTQSVYPEHEYAVAGVTILDTSGQPSTIQNEPPAKRQALYGTVDVNASTVNVINPHHTNVPDATGGAPSPTGAFTVTLDRFFRLFAEVSSTRVTPTNASSDPLASGG